MEESLDKVAKSTDEKMQSEQDKISERSAAKIMGISHQTLSNYRKRGIAPLHETIKIGGRTIVLFNKISVIEWTKNRTNPPQD